MLGKIWSGFFTKDFYAEIRKTLLVVGLLFAVYFPAMSYLQRHYPLAERPKGPPGNVGQITLILKEADTPFAYYGGISLTTEGYIPLSRYKGDIVLFEDDKELGPQSALADIRNLGEGRYGLFGKPPLIFSTSDNSDPLTNHRRYWIVVR